ncbi:MAG: metal-dependent hydrolase, partial [Lishizhenia sp.]
MDSLSQIVLGAAVGEAVLGKKIGGKAAFLGAILGTIPDLDVLLKYFFDNPLDQDLSHRGFSHSILFALFMGFSVGYLLFKLSKKNIPFKPWFTFVFLCTVTHPMLDIFTTWGTQFLWPHPERFSFNTIFVIDPFYTLPFLFCLIVALCKKRESINRKRWNLTGLALSTSYLLIGVIIKLSILSGVESKFPNENLIQSSVKPMPLTSFYWMSLNETENDFIMAYHHLWKEFDATDIQRFNKNYELLEDLDVDANEIIEKIKFITKGFLALEQKGDTLLCKDLRFGSISKLTNGKLNGSLMGYGLIIEQNSIKKVTSLRDGRNFK